MVYRYLPRKSRKYEINKKERKKKNYTGCLFSTAYFSTLNNFISIIHEEKKITDARYLDLEVLNITFK